MDKYHQTSQKQLSISDESFVRYAGSCAHKPKPIDGILN